MGYQLNVFTGQFDIVGTSGGGGGSGTVTSVAFADASSTPIYVITGSPVTTSGTLTQTLAVQAANTVFAGPTSGGSAQPTFRTLVAADIPSLAYANQQLSNLGTTAVNSPLNDSVGNPSLNLSNRTLSNGNGPTIDYNNQLLVRSFNSYTTIDWNNAYLKSFSSSTLSINWDNRTLYDASVDPQLVWSTSGIEVKTALALDGATSGAITQQASSTTTPYTITWPAAQGTGALTNNGSGVLSWSSSTITTNNKDLFVLSGTDITNQYIDLTHVALNDSIDFVVQGEGSQIEGASYDYSVNYTGGAGGNTRITFLNGLATGGSSALIAGDVVVIQYQY